MSFSVFLQAFLALGNWFLGAWKENSESWRSSLLLVNVGLQQELFHFYDTLMHVALLIRTITQLWADESGDSGFKFTSGSSRYLIIAIVYGQNETVVSDLTNTFADLKKSLGLTVDYEFKFSRSSHAFREAFLSATMKLDWQYKAIIVDKKNLNAPALINHPHQLYCESIRRLLYDNNPPLEKAVLTIDEAVAKIHHREFNSVLRQYVSKNLIRKIRQVRSNSDSMIQLADMVCGSIFRRYEKGDVV